MSLVKTGIAATVLALLAAFYFLYDKPRQEGETRQKEESEKLFTLDWEKVDRIEFQIGGDRTVIVKSGEDKWKITEPYQDDADKFAVQGLISSYRVTRPERVLEDPQENLKIYGLEDPKTSISFTASGVSQTLAFGASHRIGNTVYAKRPDAAKLFVVPESLLSDLYKPPQDLRDKTIFPSTFDKEPDRIEWVREGKVVYALARKEVPIKGEAGGDDSDAEIEKESLWTLVAPTPWWKADRDKVEEVLRGLREMRVRGVLAEKAERTAENGLADSPSVFRVTYGSGEKAEILAVEIGEVDNNSGAYFAIPPKGYLCTVPGQAVEKIDQSLHDLMDKGLVDFEISDLRSVVLRNKDISISVSRSAEGEYHSGGAGALDAQKIRGHLERAKNLAGKRFSPANRALAAARSLKRPVLVFEMMGEDGRVLANISIARLPARRKNPELVIARGSVTGEIFEMDPAVLEGWPDSIDDWLAPKPKEEKKDDDPGE